MLKHSVLSETLFHAAAPGCEQQALSLPQILARLSLGEDLVFGSLRPHQRAPWHAFLVQLAYLALDEDEEPVLPSTAKAWADSLRRLTAEYSDDAPWCLLNDDWQRPAFLQPPCSPGREGDFKRSADSAQDIDVLVTARHHDEKTGKLPLREEQLDALVYALVALQGWSAFLGAGNYQTMRMNGGFSSRPQFRLAYERGSGAEFKRDLLALLELRDLIEDKAGQMGMGSGRAPSQKLLWLLPWDGGSLPLSEVHVLCLEVCRRVRLSGQGTGLRLLRAGSDAMRVAAKALRGVVLDPWVPVVLGDEPKALTAQAHSLGYRSLQGLLLERTKTKQALLAEPTPSERRRNQPATLIAQVLVSGDGGTDGLLRRELPMSAPVLGCLVDAPGQLAQRSQRFVELAGLASGNAYRSALLQFVDGSEKVDRKNRDFARAVEPWVDHFELKIDEAFFRELFASIDLGLDDTEAQRAWAQWLKAAAHDTLPEATEALPTRNRSRAFAQVRAERLLGAVLNKQFGSLLRPEPGAADPTTTEELTHG